MNNLIKDAGVLRLGTFFLISSLLFFLLKNKLAEWEIDVVLVIVGNLIIFLSTLLAYAIYDKAVKGKSGQAFVKNIYAGFVFKFFLLITAVMMYFFFADNINLRGVFVCMGLYLVYNFMSARFASVKQKMSKISK